METVGCLRGVVGREGDICSVRGWPDGKLREAVEECRWRYLDIHSLVPVCRAPIEKEKTTVFLGDTKIGREVSLQV